MVKLRISLLFLTMSSLCLGQWPHYNPENSPQNYKGIPDSTIVKFIIMDLIHSANDGIVNPFRWNLSTEILNKYVFKSIDAENKYKLLQRNKNSLFLNANSYKTIVTNNSATVEFCYFDKDLKENIHETITLTKDAGRWSIGNSTNFLKYVYEQMSIIDNDKNYNMSLINSKMPSKDNEFENTAIQSQNNSNSVTSEVINSLIYSEYALTQRPAWYTDYFTINKTVTMNDPNIQKKLFHTISDGKVVKTVANDIFTIIADYGWDRLIYASKNRLWIKSYGELPNEQPIMWPDNVQLDKYGNIFLIANLPRTVYRFLYNEGSGDIALEQVYNLRGVIEPSDICLDYNSLDGTNNNIFWLTDKGGNAVYKMSWTGQELGRFERVISNGLSNYFNHPTKILVDNSGNMRMAVIDSEKKRVIIISNVTGFAAGAIIGDAQSYIFNDILNVSLSSIGHFTRNAYGGTALWISDKNNGVFHIFDGAYGTGYLG